MHTNKLHKGITVVLTVCLLIIALLLCQPSTLAWLTTALRSSTFSVKSSDVSSMTAELWMNAYTTYSDWTPGWYVEEIDGNLSTDTAKKFPSIGTFGTSSTTFTPASPISLHFGTINNLVQEQENKPIYLKFAITLKQHTSNTVILSYKNDAETVGGQYLSLYQIDFTKMDDTTGTYLANRVNDATLLAELNTIEDYPFLRFHYFVSTTDYSFTPGCDDLTKVAATAAGATTTVNFEELFDSSVNPDLIEYTQDNPASQSVDFDNAAATTKQTYIYVKINVRPDTLSEVLTNSNLRNYIPGYLLFAVVLGMEIRTSAYVAP